MWEGYKFAQASRALRTAGTNSTHLNKRSCSPDAYQSSVVADSDHSYWVGVSYGTGAQPVSQVWLLSSPANRIIDPQPTGVSLFIATDGGREQRLAIGEHKNQRSKLGSFTYWEKTGPFRGAFVLKTMRVKRGEPRNRCKQILLCLRMRGDEVNCWFDGINLLCLIVGDLEAEFFLKGHDDLDRVQAVQPQVLLEMRIRRHLQDLAETLERTSSSLKHLTTNITNSEKQHYTCHSSSVVQRSNATIDGQYKCHCESATIKQLNGNACRHWTENAGMQAVHHTICRLKFLTVRNKIQRLFISQPYKRYF